MKRTLLSLLVLSIFTTVTMAQTPDVDFKDKTPVDKQINFNPDLHKAMMKASTAKTPQSRWYNFAYATDTLLGGISALNYNYLFPDTTTLVNYSTGYSGAWIHMLANTLDPKSANFNDNFTFPNALKINQYMDYSLDSVKFHFYYWRGINDPSIVDTLVFEVYSSNNSADWPSYYFGPTSQAAANYATDTIRFGAYEFDGPTMASKAPGAKIYKFLLTEAFANDTLPDGSLVATFAPDIPRVQPGKVVLSTVKFIPGYTWTPNIDTMAQLNRMYFLSYEENGSETWSTYMKGDWNCSHIASDAAVYPGGSWYEMQIPEWAFTSISYGYENHVFSYLITAEETGISSVPGENIISLSQNQPNPFSNNTAISYTLSEMAEVNFDLFDQTGRKVMNIKRGLETPGSHMIELDAANLQNGIYFYTLTAGNHKASKKMVVLK